jgi:hypothetical protein
MKGMWKLPWSRVGSPVLMGAFAFCSACASLPPEVTRPPLSLQSGGLGGMKYTYEGRAPEKVLTFWGTHQRHFLDVLAEQPAAHAEARRAAPYAYASNIVLFGGSFLAIRELLAAARDADEARTIAQVADADDRLVAGAGLAALTAVTYVVLRIPVANRTLEAVRIFNAQAAPADGRDDQQGLIQRGLWAIPSTIGYEERTRRTFVTWTLPAPRIR